MYTVQKILARKRFMAQMKEEEEEEKRRTSGSSLGQPKSAPLSRKQYFALHRPKSLPSTECPFSSVALFDDTNRIKLRFPLNDMQRAALRGSWQKINKVSKNSGRGTVSMMEIVWHKLMEKDTAFKDIYYRAAFLHKPGTSTICTSRDHANFLTNWFDSVIGTLDPKNTATVYLPAPEKHANLKCLGLQSHHWEILGEVLIDVMYMQTCVRSYPHAPKAWIVFIATLTDTLRADFDKRQPRASSFQELSYL